MITAAQLSFMRARVEDTLPSTGYVLSVAYTSDGQGGMAEVWGTAGTITCRIDPLRGNEAYTGGAIQPFHGFQLTAPYNTVLSEANRLKVGAETYAIKSLDSDKSYAVSLRAVMERL